MFEEVMAVIEKYYDFSETTFDNGSQHNAAGENSGSCKLFAFAQLQGLSKQQTLSAFGQHYRDVFADPNGDSHQNIRQFMICGWNKIVFKTQPLSLKN